MLMLSNFFCIVFEKLRTKEVVNIQFSDNLSLTKLRQLQFVELDMFRRGFLSYVGLLFLIKANAVAADSIEYLGHYPDTNGGLLGIFLVNVDTMGTYNIDQSGYDFNYTLYPGSNIVYGVLPAFPNDGDLITLTDTGTSAVKATAPTTNGGDEFYFHNLSEAQLTNVVNMDSLETLDLITAPEFTQTYLNKLQLSETNKQVTANSEGVAEAMAISTMQFDLNYDGFQASFGFASFNGHQGSALMFGKKIKDSVFITLSATQSKNTALAVNLKF